MLLNIIPVSLYIHIPWCVKKCPYCDFNSHAQKGPIPEKAYVDALIDDFKTSLKDLPPNTTLHSIFIGGGTPSLFSGEAYARLFENLQKLLPFDPSIEITLEANPESVKLEHFKNYKAAGINRISLGVQSFNEAALQKLGRAHNGPEALTAIDTLTQAGFKNFNVDLMFGLPSQTIEEALSDLRQSLKSPATHISWYQLTLEPNTPFYQRPPILPEDDLLWEMQLQGQKLLKEHGFNQYEISAYTRSSFSQHNLNYWMFGDYIGIGCGAHGKLNFKRTVKIRHPKVYLEAHAKGLDLCSSIQPIETQALPFEFMLNALRLTGGFSEDLFSARTGLPIAHIEEALQKAQTQALIIRDPVQRKIIPTARGLQFLNDLITLFL